MWYDVTMVGVLSLKAKTFLVFGLSAFVILGVFGLSHTTGMAANENSGDMSGCIFTGHTMLCKMSVMEHISLWQSMVTVMPQEDWLLLVLIIFLVSILFAAQTFIGVPRLSPKEASTQKLYVTQHPALPLLDCLKEAFSQGILHPRIYEPTRL